MSNMAYERLRKFLDSVFSVKMLKKRMPILNWLPKYRLEFLLQDIIAGITVGLTVIPQSMAMAGVANLPLQYGLYSGFMGCFVYLVFGSCKDLTIGPTAILSLITQEYVKDYGEDFAVLLTFLSGCVILLMGVLNLGFLVEFISVPVTAGFISAAALTLCFTQSFPLLGIDGHSGSFLKAFRTLIKNAKTIKLWDSILGISTIIILLLLRQLKNYGSRSATQGEIWHKKIFKKICWMISLSRNAVVIILGCLLCWILEKYRLRPFTLIGNIEKGLPTFQPPPFFSNHCNITYNFIDMIEILNVNFLIVPLISVLEAVAIAKAFLKGKIVDSTQEMYALGLCNIFGSFVKSLPTTGSFTRTVINNVSGVQTQLGGAFTGFLVLLSLGYLTDYLYYIPKSVLAGLLITAVVFMIDFKMPYVLWKTKKTELLPYFGTLLTGLFFGLEASVIVGPLLHLLMVLTISARPKIDTEIIKIDSHDVLMVIPDDRLQYCSADHFSKAIMNIVFCEDDKRDYYSYIVIIDGSKIKTIDVTAATNMKVLLDALEFKKHKFFLWRMNSRVRDILLSLSPETSSLFLDCQQLEDIVKYAKSSKISVTDSSTADNV